MTDTPTTAGRSNRLIVTAAIVGSSGPAVLILDIIFSLFPFAQAVNRVVNTAEIALIWVVAGTAVAVYLVVLSVGSVTGWRLRLSQLVLTALVLLGPVAVVLSFRLSLQTCIILNPLGLPWPDDVRTVVRVIAALVILASIAGLIVGFRDRALRRTAITLTVYSGLMVVPTMFALWLTVFGDPGPTCVVG